MDRIKEIFKELAVNINKAIDGEWEKAVLNIEVLRGYSSYKGNYFKFPGCTGHSISVSRFDYAIDDMLIELHDLTRAAQLHHKDWNRAIFTLFSDNKFSIEYIWDQALQDEVDGYNNGAKPIT